MARFQVPRGTRDFLPDDMVIRNHVEKVVRRSFESFGYQQIQTPTFETFDLFADRSGEEIREEMFTFASDAGRYALRPELTASVCRLAASGALDSFPSPHKLYYFGSCFRYVRPQHGRYREFVQTGVELLGSNDPLADAEIIATAVNVLRNLGIGQFTLRVGNVGVFRSLVEEGADGAQLPDLQSQVREDVNKIMDVTEKCRIFAGQDQLSREDKTYIDSVRNTYHNRQEQIRYQGSYGVVPYGQEPSEAKHREWLEELPRIVADTCRESWVNSGVSAKQADLLLEVALLRGSRNETIGRAGNLLVGHKAAEAALGELSKVCDWLETLGLSDIEVALGTVRNLDFYTGTVFELDCSLLGAQKQMCGGGRYDGLVELFGGRSTPATGFAFGFDRLVEAFRETQESDQPFDTRSVQVLVVSPPEQRKTTVQVAELIRAHGFRVAVDLRSGVDIREQMEYFWKLKAEFLVTVGVDYGSNGKCKLQQRLQGSRGLSSENILTVSAVVDSLKANATKGRK